ncbi:MAG: cobalamin biosynthesis protein [Planctomycetota bacterium]|nr:cobalamin biosynthesis protein [Planctomycetota bacterium]
MKTAIITLSPMGLMIAERLADHLPDSRVYRHITLARNDDDSTFERIKDISAKLFPKVKNLLYVMPTGVAVRAIAPLVRHKLNDPAVVLVDVGGRWAVSLLSGHEGGANDLANEVANILDAESIVSTTTEAARSLIVGVGCRKGVAVEDVVAAIEEGLALIDTDVEDLRLIASVDVKKDESGLIEAAKSLGRPLRFISSDAVRNSALNFSESPAARKRVNLPAVAEPAALLAGRRTKLLLPKTVINGVTVAVAKENFLS